MELQNSLLSNINDNGNNNEKKKKKERKIGREYLKARVVIFQEGIFQGDSPGESLIGGNFPGGSCPDTKENICEEFSSVHALTLIFI